MNLGPRSELPDDQANSARIAELRSKIEQLERALSASEERVALERLKLQATESALWQLSVLFGNVPIAVILLDLTGVVTDVNHEAERLFDQRREGLLGKRLADLVAPSRRDDCEAMLARSRAGEVVRGVEHRLWGDTGAARSESAALFPLRSKSNTVIGIALAEDVREIKDARELLVDVNRKLQLLASVDSLTRVPNRRSYEAALKRELRRAQREVQPFSLALIDVDHFKPLNDRLGHVAGDDCLRAIAAALSAVVHRPGDLVARYGGEEFGAILTGTGAAAARLLGERFCAAVRDLGLVHPDSPVAPVVTVSVGLASIADPRTITPAALQVAADAALYRAKAAGRDCVELVELRPGNPVVTDGPGASAGPDADQSGD